MHRGSKAVFTQLRRGTAEFCLLALLEQGEDYGFSIMGRLKNHPGLELSEGSLYPLLARLQRDGLVQTRTEASITGPSRKFFALTVLGKVALQQFRNDWDVFSTSVDRILGGTSGE